MSFLDLAQHDQEAADSWVRTHSEARLPATFTEGFQAAWSENQLFGQSTAHSAAREKAFANYADELKARGVPYQDPQGRFIQDQYNPPDLDQKMQAAQEAATKAGIEPIDDAELDRRAIQLSREARAGYSAMAAREKGPGGGVGFLAGGLAGAATDPINLAALPVAPAEGLPLLAYALRWGAIAGASQAAIEVAGAPYHETVQPGYLESGEPLANVAGGFAGGAATGGAIRTLGRLWTRVKTGAWPTSVRDAGNFAESEANIQATNVYPGAAGEAAHRDGLATAIDQVVKGEPVDVSEHITPAVEASADERLAPLMEARAAAQRAAAEAEAARPVGPAPELPFEQTAAQAQAEQATNALAGEIAKVADRAGYEMPEDEAKSVAARMVKAPDEQVAQTLDTIVSNPSYAAEVKPAKVTGPPPPEVNGVLPPEAAAKMLGSPEHEAAIRADIDRARAAAATGQGAQEITTSNLKKQFGGPNFEYDSKAADAFIRSEIQKGLAAGNRVTLTVEGKTKRIVEVSTLGLKDENGNSWGTTALMMQKPGEDAVIRISKPADVKIPVGIDEKGEPIYRSLDSAMNEIDALKAAADHIQACVNPPAEPADG